MVFCPLQHTRVHTYIDRRRHACLLRRDTSPHPTCSIRGGDNEIRILFMFSLFHEHLYLENVRIHLIYRVNQAEYGIHILVAAFQEYVNTYSTRRPHPGQRGHNPWLLHDIAFPILYGVCHTQGRVVYCAIVVQQCCIIVGNASGKRQCKDV